MAPSATLARPRHAVVRAAADGRGVLLLLAVAALVLPASLVRSPAATMIGLLGLLALVSVALRLEAAFLLLVAVAPFEAFVAVAAGPNAVKGVGLLVFVAWGVRALGSGTSGLVAHPTLVAAAVLALTVVLSALVTLNGTDGLLTVVRYLSFLGTFVVAVSLLRDRATAWRVGAVSVLAASAASLAGLYAFVTGTAARANGPLGDPNDLAFFLAAALPVGLALAARSRRRGQAGARWWGLCCVVLGVGIAATLSRGAILGLVVALVWAAAHRLVNPRLVAAGAGALALALGAITVAVPSLVDRALDEKSNVAAENVDTRTERWAAAAAMFFDRPLTGVGPAGFGVQYPTYAPGAVTEGPTVAHQMYLDVASELGVAGIGSFLTLLALSYRGAVRATRRTAAADPDDPDVLLGWAVRGALVVVLTSSLFLTEQFYLPLWMLCAYGVALELGPARAPDGPA